MFLRELRLTYRVRADVPNFDAQKRLGLPRDVAHFLAPILEPEAVEVFGAICLTTRHHPIAWHELSRGTLDATLVHPREVFKVALLANAAALVLAHNHPSGDPSPSPDDIALTQRLVSAGELLGVAVLDHVIVGYDGTYFSFMEAQRL
jgi:DNA repair protein RadC